MDKQGSPGCKGERESLYPRLENNISENMKCNFDKYDFHYDLEFNEAENILKFRISNKTDYKEWEAIITNENINSNFYTPKSIFNIFEKIGRYPYFASNLPFNYKILFTKNDNSENLEIEISYFMEFDESCKHNKIIIIEPTKVDQYRNVMNEINDVKELIKNKNKNNASDDITYKDLMYIGLGICGFLMILKECSRSRY